MYDVVAEIVGVSELSYGQIFKSTRLSDESHEAFDARCWRERAHWSGGKLVIEPSTFWRATIQAAKTEKIKGSRGANYSKLIASGVSMNECVTVLDPINHMPISKETIEYGDFMVSVNGSGTGPKVTRRFPMVQPGWTGTLRFQVTNDLLSGDLMKKFVAYVGNRLGILRFRPSSTITAGWYGRFNITDWRIIVDPSQAQAA
jgi:hypothetical protein